MQKFNVSSLFYNVSIMNFYFYLLSSSIFCMIINYCNHPVVRSMYLKLIASRYYLFWPIIYRRLPYCFEIRLLERIFPHRYQSQSQGKMLVITVMLVQGVLLMAACP